MNAAQFKAKHVKNPKHIAKVCKKAGTSTGYLDLIAAEWRRPSVKLAKRLVEASGGELDLVSLLDFETKKKAA